MRNYRYSLNLIDKFQDDLKCWECIPVGQSRYDPRPTPNEPHIQIIVERKLKKLNFKISGKTIPDGNCFIHGLLDQMRYSKSHFYKNQVYIRTHSTPFDRISYDRKVGR